MVITVNRIVQGIISTALVMGLAGCGESSSGEAQAAATESATVQVGQTDAGQGSQLGQMGAEAEVKEPRKRTTKETPAPPPVALDPTATQRRPADRTQVSVSTLKVEPVSLDLGTVAANKYATGTVKVTNTGGEPITIQQCKTSCGCTSTNCPKGKDLEAGESRDIDIRITAGSRERPISKTVTFIVEGQRPVTLPVKVQVKEYVQVEPSPIDPDKVADGKLVIRAKDEEPFRIVSMNPPILESFDEEAKLEHELYIDWETWRQLGQGRRLVFTLDHPQADQATVLVRGASVARDTRAAARDDRNLLADTRDRLRADGVRDDPLEPVGPDKQMLIAVKYGDLATINEGLEGGAISEANRNSLLHTAARYGRVEIMAALIEAGADVNTTDSRGRTPLVTAAQSRNNAAVSLLLERGADASARDATAGTALLRAAGFGSAEMTRKLIAAGANVNAADGNGQTPLMWAARWGDTARVKALLEAGANPSARDAKGMTALDYARNRGESGEPIVEALE